MRILGIDPGTVAMGYGVLEAEDDPRAVGYGVLTTSARLPLEQRLSQLYHKLLEILVDYEPTEVAIEEPFVAQNVRTALAVGRAQAVAILAAANQGLPIFYYTPTQVKHQITDYGGSSKEQVQEMVRLQLRLTELPQPSDASDALAIALCHLRQSHLNRLISQQSSSS